MIDPGDQPIRFDTDSSATIAQREISAQLFAVSMEISSVQTTLGWTMLLTFFNSGLLIATLLR